MDKPQEKTNPGQPAFVGSLHGKESANLAKTTAYVASSKPERVLALAQNQNTSANHNPLFAELEAAFAEVKDLTLRKIQADALVVAELLRLYQFNDAADCCYLYPLVYLPEYQGDKTPDFLVPEQLPLWKAFQLMLLRENKENLSKQEKLAENIKQLMVAASFDLRVLFVRLGLWLNQLKNMGQLAHEEAENLAENTLAIYAKIAHRLGLYLMKSEMEHLAFKWLKKADFQKIEKRLAGQVEDRRSFYVEMERFYSEKLAAEKIGYHFSYRTKEIYSIYLKTLDQADYLENLYDSIACRFLVNTIEECYKVLAIVHSSNFPIPGRFKDYIHHPKLNGYQSLHTTVKNPSGIVYEVQIRTHQMHQENEYGFASHWSYKEKTSAKVQENVQIAWLRNLVSEYSQKGDIQSGFEDFQRELNANSIYVFTPQGKMIRLPKGATVIDFAYAIHSGIGNTCAGARVDGKFSPIRKVLENGQQIEVITNSQSKPNREWLEHCLTNKAIYHIRSSIKQQSAENVIQLGERILQKACEQNKIEFKGIENAVPVQKFLRKKSFAKFPDLLSALGFGSVEISELIQYIRSIEAERSKQAKKSTISKLLGPFNRLKPSGKLEISQLKGIPTRIAQCCQPLPGDSIMGVISNSGMIKIHRAGCPNIKEGRGQGTQVLVLSWDQTDDKKFSVPVWFEFPSKSDHLSEIVRCLADLKVVILQSNLEPSTLNPDHKRFNTVLECSDFGILDKMREKLKKFPHIHLYQNPTNL